MFIPFHSEWCFFLKPVYRIEYSPTQQWSKIQTEVLIRILHPQSVEKDISRTIIYNTRNNRHSVLFPTTCPWLHSVTETVLMSRNTNIVLSSVSDVPLLSPSTRSYFKVNIFVPLHRTSDVKRRGMRFDMTRKITPSLHRKS